MPSPRLAILASHPVQYYAPLFRGLAQRVDLHVYYAHNATAEQQAAAGFGRAFTWDIDLTSGYAHFFLRNVATQSGTDHFAGCDTPEIGERLRDGHFDVVLALGWHLKSMLQGIFAARRLGIPVMVRGDSQLGTPRGAVKTAVKRVTYPALLRVFDAALYVGQRNFDYYRHFGYPAARLFHSPHCVDTERFAASATPQARMELRSRLDIRNDEKVVLFAGKLVPFKRPVDVVEGVAQVMQRGVSARLMVAGSGPMEADMRAKAQALGVTVDFLGFQNQTEMPSAYAAADLMVLPSTGRETWGLVCNEALACGTPIVVSDQVGCALDLAKDRLVGRSFSMGNITELADACAATLANPPSSAAIRAVSDQFSIQRAVGGIVEAVEMVVSGRRRSGERVVR
jgi:glycosyltransferase involved in cell wall biosynthesis